MKVHQIALLHQPSRQADDLICDALILNSIRDAVIATNLEGVVTSWNDGAARLFGWSAEEMVGRPYMDRFPEEVRSWIAQEIRSRAAGEDWDGEFEDYRKDGSRVWITARVRLIHDTQGAAIGLLGISHDISDRKRAEQVAATLAQFERDVLDSMTAHVAVIAPDGTIRAVNRAWRDFTRLNAPPGKSSAEHTDVGSNYLTVCRHSSGPWSEEAQVVHDGITAVLTGSLPRFDLEYPCHSPTTERWFHLSVTPLTTGDGGAVIAHMEITRRKQAELALSRSEERLRLALAASQMGVWEINLDSGAISWSPEVYTIFRAPHFAGTREELARLIYPADLDRVLQASTEAVSNRQLFDVNFRIVWPDQQIRWVANLGQVQVDSAGRPTSMIGTVQDITATKRAEQVLIGQNRVLELIATGAALPRILEEIVLVVEQQIPGSLCSVLLLRDERLWFGAGPNLPEVYNTAIDGIPIGPSAGSCGTAAYLGAPVVVDDIAADPLWERYRDVALPHSLRACWSMPIVASATEATAQTDRTVLGTFALYRREVSWPEPETGTILASAAHLAGLAIERNTVQRQLRESEERFRLLVDGVRDYAVYLADPSGTVITWNLGAERTYGYPTHEAVGGSIARFSIPEEAANERPLHDLHDAAAHGSYEVEGWRQRKDGTTFWANVVTTALFRHDGTLRGFAIVVRDQTTHHRLEEQLRQSQKMEAIGQLAGGVAHDFNNLLTVINGYSQILSDDLPPDAAQQELLTAILEAGEKASRLTGQLLAFSRKAIVEPQIIDLNTVVSNTSKLLRRLIGEDITLQTCLSPTIGLIRIDPGQLDQVLFNLAVNARDAMPTGGRLTISTGQITIATTYLGDDLPPGDYVELLVADTGEGMRDAVKARIFEPFFTTKDTGKGTGLGLATAYGIIRQAGGQILVESAPGQGALFRVRLPVISTESPQAHPKRTSDRLYGSETILIAEDEPEVRRLARRTLEQYGYTVIEAGTGMEAHLIAEAYASPIHLLITDVVMPGMSGRALAEVIRGRRSSVAILFTSGYTEDAVIRHGISTTAEFFLQKPFSPLSLTQKVRQILDQVYP